jgi:hypothetical protein
LKELTPASIRASQVGALVVVLHGQHVLFERHHLAAAVGHVVGQAAGLRAVAAVGAAAGVGMADEALAAVGHAQRAVDEKLDGAVGVDRDVADLFQVQFARQHDLAEAHVLQELGFFDRADVGLGGGVQLDRGQVELQQAHVLHDQRVHPGVVQLPDLLAGAFQLVVAQDGVERGEHLGVVAVGVLCQAGNVLHRIAGVGARPERRPTDVDGIGTVVDGLDADVGGLGGCEQFKGVAGGEEHG